MNHFKDKVAVVTGGASGIGRTLCEDLGQRGAVVIVADINGEGAEQVSSAISKSGGRASASHLDVSQEKDVRKLINDTASEHGQLDFMFNNAGIAIGGEMRDMNLEHWRRVLDVNLFGVLYGTAAAYSLMVRQGFGHIVNTASLAGLLGYPTNLPYGTTKFAVVGLSTSLRAEAADLGVKVSVVCPGYVQTGIFDSTIVLNANMEDLLANIPFKIIDASKATQKILRGVERNRAIIVFPFYARLLWWLYRLNPVTLDPINRKMVSAFRELRREPE